MHVKTLYVILGALVALSAATQAAPIPGSDNELLNWDFDHPAVQQDPWSPWEHGSGLALGEVDGHGNAVFCKDPQANLLMRQVVDESENALWDWTKHAKWIDLTAEIMCVDMHVPTMSGVRFCLDYWFEDRNVINDPTQLPAPDGYTDWVPIYFADIPGYKPFTWYTVNPFDVNKAWFADFQPRWVSVEVELIQWPGEVVWIDNLELTAKCVPEPAAILALLTGIVGLGAFRAFKRK